MRSRKRGPGRCPRCHLERHIAAAVGEIVAAAATRGRYSLPSERYIAAAVQEIVAAAAARREKGLPSERHIVAA